MTYRIFTSRNPHCDKSVGGVLKGTLGQAIQNEKASRLPCWMNLSQIISKHNQQDYLLITTKIRGKANDISIQ